MSLLDDKYPLVFSPKLAMAIGLNEAIFLHQVHYWMEHTHKEWVYNSYPAWQKQFPFWSIYKIIRTINNLEKSGYLRSKQLASTDRKKHYSINYAAVDALEQQSE